MGLRANLALLACCSCDGYVDLGSREPQSELRQVETYDDWYTRTLTTTAAHDLACPISSLTRSVGELQVAVRTRFEAWGTVELDVIEGCGLRASYAVRCSRPRDIYDHERQSCQPIILSRVEIPR
jgi:hypothetical protein